MYMLRELFFYFFFCFWYETKRFYKDLKVDQSTWDFNLYFIAGIDFHVLFPKSRYISQIQI